MAYWLMKSEPDSWSWDQQVKAGAKGTEWTGVRNHTAKQIDEDEEGRSRVLLIPSVGKDDRRRRRGGPRASSRSDRGEGEPWVVVDVKAVGPVPRPVTLEAIKNEPKLRTWRW